MVRKIEIRGFRQSYEMSEKWLGLTTMAGTHV